MKTPLDEQLSETRFMRNPKMKEQMEWFWNTNHRAEYVSLAIQMIVAEEQIKAAVKE